MKIPNLNNLEKLENGNFRDKTTFITYSKEFINDIKENAEKEAKAKKEEKK